ncbi:MAG: C69 family dipeptidase, partial [Firmicutes bacterium]|nr:C69 family dipeptidase [Bacillota bacterium]
EGFTWQVEGQTYGWHRAISLTRCEHVCIAQLRGWLPNDIGGVLWYGAAAAGTTCFVPFYVGLNEVSEVINTKAGSRMKFTRESYWWAAASVMNYADLKWSYMIKDINAMQQKYEGRVLRGQPAIDAAATELLQPQHRRSARRVEGSP